MSISVARPGVFIVFEGGDGAGKSTQVRLLAEYLRAAGQSVCVTREPGGTELGAAIRQLLLHGGEMHSRAEALLYAADRAHHVATLVRPALTRGEIVVQDRYIDSSVAYQGAGRVLGAEEVAKLSDWATAGLMPDLTILLDVAGELGARRRTQETGVADRIERESAAFHEQVRQGFLARAQAHPERYFVLDAAESIDVLHQRIIARVHQLLDEKRG